MTFVDSAFLPGVHSGVVPDKKLVGLCRLEYWTLVVFEPVIRPAQHFWVWDLQSLG
jgi:hypothetical protein